MVTNLLNSGLSSFLPSPGGQLSWMLEAWLTDFYFIECIIPYSSGPHSFWWAVSWWLTRETVNMRSSCLFLIAFKFFVFPESNVRSCGSLNPFYMEFVELLWMIILMLPISFVKFSGIISSNMLLFFSLLICGSHNRCIQFFFMPSYSSLRFCSLFSSFFFLSFSSSVWIMCFALFSSDLICLSYFELVFLFSLYLA